MRVGFVGLGKLGLPVAATLSAMPGIDVCGTDTNPRVRGHLEAATSPTVEDGLAPLLESRLIEWCTTVADVVDRSDIVFIAVQTPHHPDLDGSKPLAGLRADFDYTALEAALADVAEHARHSDKVVAVISTVLPGTWRARLRSTADGIHYAYNPYFIAMGTVVDDFLDPEFVLVGTDDDHAAKVLEDFYRTALGDVPLLFTDVTTAEATKVLYNTAITMKTVLANAAGQLAHTVGFDVDVVHKAWSLATERIASPAYLRAGMGDGGACHPRDNLALAWLADRRFVEPNVWDMFMAARDEQAAWLADLTIREAGGLPIVVLGKAFKPGTSITAGSPANLVRHYIEADGAVLAPAVYDPYVDTDKPHFGVACYLIATQHPEFVDYRFPAGSVVVDPFRYMPDIDGVRVVRIGGAR